MAGLKTNKNDLLEVARNFASSLEFGSIGENVKVLFDYKNEFFYTNRDLEVERSKSEIVILSMTIDGEKYLPEEILDMIVEVLLDRYDNLEIE